MVNISFFSIFTVISVLLAIFACSSVFFFCSSALPVLSSLEYVFASPGVLFVFFAFPRYFGAIFLLPEEDSETRRKPPDSPSRLRK